MASVGELMGNVKESVRTCGGLFELTEKRNVISSAFAGALVSLSTFLFSEVDGLEDFFLFLVVHNRVVVHHR